MVIFTNCKMRILLICISKIHRFRKLPFQPSSLLAWPWETRCKEEGIHFLAWVGGVGTAGSHCPASATNWYYQLHFSDISIPIHVFWSLWCQNKGRIIKHFALWPCCKVCLAHCVPAELDTLHLSWYTQPFISATLSSFFRYWQKRNMLPQCNPALSWIPVTSCLTFSLQFRGRWLLWGSHLWGKTGPSLHFSHWLRNSKFFALPSFTQNKIFAGQPDNAQ